MKFRLLRGVHSQTEKDGTVAVYEARVSGKNIVESDIELDKMFGAEKFQRLDDVDNSSLVMNRDEMRKLADKLGIDYDDSVTDKELAEMIQFELGD
ncbi:MAG: hypothetical protein QXI61_06975 [Nitrososphaerota archaeon]